MALRDDITAAENCAKTVKERRKGLRHLPEDEKVAVIDELLGELRAAMKPIRSARGQCVERPAELEQLLIGASSKLQKQREGIRATLNRIDRSPQPARSPSGQRRDKCKQRNYDYVETLKQSLYCMDCNGSFPSVAMDFDHVRGEKVANIGTLCSAAAPLQKLKDEIAKCELVCANCHRVRTRDRWKAKQAD